jgi:LacI family transcriptional regulator
MAERIRIKDIALKAGVSVGTVDRVLHKRPNVSAKAREKVEKVLKEQNYEPNIYASALAYNKSYHFCVLIPRHDQVAYWEEVEQGVKKAADLRKDFNISVSLHYYDRFDNENFLAEAESCFDNKLDGMVIVPAPLDITKQVTDRLHEESIPFVLLDSYMPDLRPLAFFGQDSFASGYFAARMLMLLARDQQEIMFMKITKDGKVVSKQQDNREVGFRHYMHDHFPSINILTLELPFYGNRQQYDAMFDDFFNRHPHTHHCITMGSKAHVLGEFLLRTNRRDVQIMGYDMVKKNAECLKQGSISFLIAQHGYQQGYFCVEALFRAVVLKTKIQPVNYMPIELLTPENVDFYRRFQL